MRKLILSVFFAAFFLVAALNFVSAISVKSVTVEELAPGEEGAIRIILENNLNDDVEDVSLGLVFEKISGISSTGVTTSGEKIPFIPVGTSEGSVDKIESDDEETFVFRVKAASDAKAGDYEIPYTIQYKVSGETLSRTKQGTIGVRLKANPELVYSINIENPVQGMKGKITLKIVNKGFYDARFVSLKVLDNGYKLLSSDEAYIGTVNSDDFETASFDVLFNGKNPEFDAIIEYLDFDNKKLTKNINLPIVVYTSQKAKELGIIKQSYILYYVLGVILLIILIILWRTLRRRARMKRSQIRNNAEGK